MKTYFLLLTSWSCPWNFKNTNFEEEKNVEFSKPMSPTRLSKVSLRNVSQLGIAVWPAIANIVLGIY